MPDLISYSETDLAPALVVAEEEVVSFRDAVKISPMRVRALGYNSMITALLDVISLVGRKPPGPTPEPPPMLTGPLDYTDFTRSDLLEALNNLHDSILAFAGTVEDDIHSTTTWDTLIDSIEALWSLVST